MVAASQGHTWQSPQANGQDPRERPGTPSAQPDRGDSGPPDTPALRRLRNCDLARLAISHYGMVHGRRVVLARARPGRWRSIQCPRGVPRCGTAVCRASQHGLTWAELAGLIGIRGNQAAPVISELDVIVIHIRAGPGRKVRAAICRARAAALARGACIGARIIPCRLPRSLSDPAREPLGSNLSNASLIVGIMRVQGVLHSSGSEPGPRAKAGQWCLDQANSRHCPATWLSSKVIAHMFFTDSVMGITGKAAPSRSLTLSGVSYAGSPPRCGCATGRESPVVGTWGRSR